jgi:hypothetical protein
MKKRYLWNAKVKLTDGRSATVDGDMILHEFSNLREAERELFYTLDNEYQRKVGTGVYNMSVTWREG